ncbi:MAG: MarR family transcriptional regulator [Halobacteriaceae archaeon]
MRSIVPACHEYQAEHLFADLAAFFACDRRVKEGEGSQTGTFEVDGETWQVKLYYQDSGIVTPSGDELPTGTEWRLDEVREFRLAVERASDEDPTGEQSFNAHLRPRWKGMEVENDHGDTFELDLPPLPGDEAISVRINGSNIDFERYGELLRRGFDAVGVGARYFRDPLPLSTVTDAEVYVRLSKDVSGPVHARDGAIAEMGHLLENDRQGYRKVVQNDDDNHGQNLPGFYHTVTLGSRRVREAFPSHATPKEVKHYYAKEARERDESDPLAHPKVGASYQVSQWDGSVRLTEGGVERADGEAVTMTEMRDELETTLRSVLADAGLDLAPSGGEPPEEREQGDRVGPYVVDAYFRAEVSDGWDEPISLDLTHIRQEQESVVVRHLSDGLSPVQWESLDTLVSDGGEVAPADIAEENDRHVGSVRRALREMSDLVERERARVSLASEYVAEMVHDAVKEARESYERAAETTAKAVEAAERGLDETMSAFVAWAARHGVDVDGAKDARMTLRYGEKPSNKELVRALRAGLRVWTDAGLPAEDYRMARVEFAGEGGSAKVWRYLADSNVS